MADAQASELKIRTAQKRRSKALAKRSKSRTLKDLLLQKP